MNVQNPESIHTYSLSLPFGAKTALELLSNDLRCSTDEIANYALLFMHQLFQAKHPDNRIIIRDEQSKNQIGLSVPIAREDLVSLNHDGFLCTYLLEEAHLLSEDKLVINLDYFGYRFIQILIANKIIESHEEILRYALMTFISAVNQCRDSNWHVVVQTKSFDYVTLSIPGFCQA